MAARNRTTRIQPSAGPVDELMRTLDHPLRSDVQLVRFTILGVGPGIARFEATVRQWIARLL